MCIWIKIWKLKRRWRSSWHIVLGAFTYRSSCMHDSSGLFIFLSRFTCGLFVYPDPVSGSRRAERWHGNLHNTQPSRVRFLPIDDEQTVWLQQAAKWARTVLCHQCDVPRVHFAVLHSSSRRFNKHELRSTEVTRDLEYVRVSVGWRISKTCRKDGFVALNRLLCSLWFREDKKTNI